MRSGSVARVQPRFHPREPARDPRDQSIELRCHRPGSMLRPRVHGHIIWTPHKPGMITRWPPHVAPPRPTLRSPAAVSVRPTCAINPPTGHPSHSLFVGLRQLQQPGRAPSRDDVVEPGDRLAPRK
jgi:hypothetical protein